MDRNRNRRWSHSFTVVPFDHATGTEEKKRKGEKECAVQGCVRTSNFDLSSVLCKVRAAPPRAGNRLQIGFGVVLLQVQQHIRYNQKYLDSSSFLRARTAVRGRHVARSAKPIGVRPRYQVGGSSVTIRRFS